jgi:MFS family permease
MFCRFVDQIDSSVSSNMFVIYCFVLRIFLALGCTASATASFAVTARVYPDNVATVFGLLETASGLGMMVGPALGGLLYQVS